MITQQILKELFTYDEVDGGLYWKVSKMGVTKGSRYGYEEKNNNYRKGIVNGNEIREHRLVWMYHNGDIPNRMVIDHINRNKSDNRIQNLRVVTPSMNGKNRVDNFWKHSQNNLIVE
jgi:hypothetical protein